MCGVHNDNDIYAPIQQKLWQMTESTPLWQTRIAYSSTWKIFQNRCEWSACCHGEFSLWCRKSKAFCEHPFALQPWASEEFFPGVAGPLADFSKIFLGVPKVVKYVFSHSKLRKQPFCWNFQNPGGKALQPPLPTPMIATSATWKRSAKCRRTLPPLEKFLRTPMTTLILSLSRLSRVCKSG